MDMELPLLRITSQICVVVVGIVVKHLCFVDDVRFHLFKDILLKIFGFRKT